MISVDTKSFAKQVSDFKKTFKNFDKTLVDTLSDDNIVKDANTILSFGVQYAVDNYITYQDDMMPINAENDIVPKKTSEGFSLVCGQNVLAQPTSTGDYINLFYYLNFGYGIVGSENRNETLANSGLSWNYDQNEHGTNGWSYTWTANGGDGNKYHSNGIVGYDFVDDLKRRTIKSLRFKKLYMDVLKDKLEGK